MTLQETAGERRRLPPTAHCGDCHCRSLSRSRTALTQLRQFAGATDGFFYHPKPCMDTDSIDYDALTLAMERRIRRHVSMAIKERPSAELNEKTFFTVAANEALFVWMLLAGALKSGDYETDRARLVGIVEGAGLNGVAGTVHPG